jgi:hypothetical protein
VKLWDAKDINPLNPKALPKATVQSGPGGVFVFEKVDPGSYYVSSEFPFHKLTGITGPVVVPTKDQKDVTGVVISLK